MKALKQMNNILLSQTTICSNQPKPTETTVSEQVSTPNQQQYENFKIVNNDDSKFYKTRCIYLCPEIGIEPIIFALRQMS